MKAREYVRRFNDVSDETKDRRKKLKDEIEDLSTIKHIFLVVKFLPLIIFGIPSVLVFKIFYERREGRK
jgi:hypothetical protein